MVGVCGLFLDNLVYSWLADDVIKIQKSKLCHPTKLFLTRHCSPLFRKLKILKVSDLLYLYCALFMYDYYFNRLPLIFNDFFKSINKVHQYKTRLASKISYYLPKARINYGKFNIRFFGAKVWNSIEESLKSKSRTCFKILLKIQNSKSS